jgi:hypothetical protein
LTDCARVAYKHRVWCSWEAGEIPARPRHCECRGFEQFATGDRLWEGSSDPLTHESGDRPDAALVQSTSKGESMGVLTSLVSAFHFRSRQPLMAPRAGCDARSTADLAR